MDWLLRDWRSYTTQETDEALERETLFVSVPQLEPRGSRNIG